MTREEAIKRYDRIRYNLLNPNDKEAVDIAFEALREQDVTDTNVGSKTNADHIRSMTDEELSEFLEYLYSHCDGPWEILFERKFCDHCPAPEYELEDGRNLKLHECDFTGGKCPHGSDVLWWLKQTYKEDA